jgi:hypothetical protein
MENPGAKGDLDAGHLNGHYLDQAIHKDTHGLEYHTCETP